MQQQWEGVGKAPQRLTRLQLFLEIRGLINPAILLQMLQLLAQSPQQEPLFQILIHFQIPGTPMVGSSYLMLFVCFVVDYLW